MAYLDASAAGGGDLSLSEAPSMLGAGPELATAAMEGDAAAVRRIVGDERNGTKALESYGGTGAAGLFPAGYL